jgi:CheY-like chemotaxis protein
MGGPVFPRMCPFCARRSGPAPVSVLCVDDNPDLLVVARLCLEQDDKIAVTTCPSPVQAFSLVQRAGFDIIVSDYDMPEMNGITLFERLRTAGCRTPFILFTGCDASAIPGLARILKENPDAYISKTIGRGSPFRRLRENLLRHAALPFDPVGE